jgi:hypothetical protein
VDDPKSGAVQVCLGNEDRLPESQSTPRVAPAPLGVCLLYETVYVDEKKF